jgi:phage protein D
MAALALSLPGAAPDGLRRPRVEISVANEAPDAWAEHLLGCEVRMALLPNVDRVRLILAAAGPNPAIADPGEIALGYEDAGTSAVFSGEVSDVRDALDGTRTVTLCNASAKLARARANTSYERQSAGDIVRDLASQAGADVGTVEPGTNYPFLAIDDGRSLLDHVAALARRSGFIATFDAQGALEFRSAGQTPSVQTFHYGADVLSVELSRGAPRLGTARVIGEGAAGSEGQDAWSWLLKDPQSLTSNAGQGAPTRLTIEPSLRSAQATQSAADAVSRRAAHDAEIGSVCVAGAPLVRPGSVVELAGMPHAPLDGAVLVTSVVHAFDKRRGFTTRLRFAKQAASGLPGGFS